jgi:hypothetical protein
MQKMTGCTLARADEMRRMLGKDSNVSAIEKYFRNSALARGYSKVVIERVWSIIEGFGSFGFCKAHGAAFALPTYQSAWLKTHYPTEFIAGLLTHDPGMYPIAIQAICGNTIRSKIFYLTIDSCYRVTVNSAVSQYNLQQVNSLPGVGTPICVVLDVTNTGQLTSTNPSIPTYTSGPLDPQSHVGIRNYGAFLSLGGNGGDGGSLSTFGSPGQIGGNAINMTTKTSILNYGFIYGGGGGGGSVGLSQDIDIPLFGTWTLAIGAGGGGGCALGQGGGTGGSIIGFWDNGQSATGGLNAQPGQGGEINLPIPIPLGPVTITINPDVEGGEGGNYGLQGTSGNLTINISATIPIIGTINIPTPAITNFPAGGEEGFAVKKNGQILNGVPVGNFQLNNLKGKVND